MKRITFLLPILLLLAACDQAANQENIGRAGCTSLDYKNGVYYFPCASSEFGNALSQFKKHNPNLRVTAISGNGKGGYGANSGYFVTTETRLK